MACSQKGQELPRYDCRSISTYAVKLSDGIGFQSIAPSGGVSNHRSVTISAERQEELAGPDFGARNRTVPGFHATRDQHL